MDISATKNTPKNYYELEKNTSETKQWNQAIVKQLMWSLNTKMSFNTVHLAEFGFLIVWRCLLTHLDFWSFLTAVFL